MLGMLILVLSVLAALAVCILVIARRIFDNRTFAYTLLTFFSIVVSIANYLAIEEKTSQLTYVRFVMAGATLTVYSYYLLILSLRRRKINLVYQLFLAFMTVGVAILDMTDIVFKDIILGSPPSPIPGPGIIVFFLHLIVVTVTAVLLLTSNIRQSRGKNERSQYRPLIIGLLPIVFFAPLTSYILPNFFDTKQFIIVTPLYASFFVVCVGYSILRHGLFDIRQAIVRTFSYVLSLISLGLIYFIIAYFVSSVFIRNNSTFSVGPINIVLALILAFIFQPVKRFFDRVTNLIFYRDVYSTEEFFARLTQKISTMTDLVPLLVYASTEISRTLKSSFGAFIVYRANGQEVYVAGDKRRKIPSQDMAELDTYVTKKTSSLIITDQLQSSEASLKRLLTSHRIAIVLPIMQNVTITGYLFLGEHLSAQYTQRDIRALETIANELLIAIQNALSLQAVKDLNSTLQQRIDIATKELRATNAQLHRLDEAKDEFMSIASHQLRTPLTSVKGYISMVLEGDAGKISANQKKLLDEAFSSSERMVHLINDFLNVSRLQTGKFSIDKSTIDLGTVVQEELNSLEANAARKGMSFSYSAPKKFPSLSIDESKIRQVIMNYCDNAIYYSADNTKIKVDLSLNDKDVIFTVKDTGIGVPLSEQAHLFGKFFRATNARTQRPDGTGVGLFLAKKVVVAHGGDVIFESKENKGSTFGFRLPLSKVQPEE